MAFKLDNGASIIIDGGRVLVVDTPGGRIIAVDPVSGDRTLFSQSGANGRGDGSLLDTPRTGVLDTAGSRLLVTASRDDILFAVDLDDGDRTIILPWGHLRCRYRGCL